MSSSSAATSAKAKDNKAAGLKSRKSASSSNNTQPTLNPKRTAQQYSDPAPFRMQPGTTATVPSAQPLGWSTLTLKTFHRHPYITYAAPVTLLAMGWSAVQVTSVRAAEPLLGTVLAHRYVDTVTAFCLLPTWLAARVWVQWSNRRDLRKRGLAAAIAQSGFAALTPDRIDYLFLLAARLVAVAALLVVAAPLTRDWMVACAEAPRETLDKYVKGIVLPVVQAVFGSHGSEGVATQVTPTTALLAYLPTSVSAPLTSLLATHLPTHAPLPAWLHPHLAYALSLYPAAALIGIVVALFPYLTATPLAPAHALERHVKFSRLLVPIAWFFFANVGRSLTLLALRLHGGAWVYPETLLAGLGVGVAVLAGVLIPLVYPPYTKTRGGYVHFFLALASVGLVTYLTMAGRGHYVRDVFDPVPINDDYTLHAKRGPVMILSDSSRNIQVMRAGHSLLGGTYTRGNDAGDSVFYGFYFHDAHRLVRDRPLAQVVDQGADPKSVKGLMIGYGIGVAAHAYVHQGVPLDIVELDKDVLDLARAYFPLPAGPHGDPPAGVEFHVADGRQFVEHTRGGTYDFVIHDVFSGGSVPSPMFTWQTMAHLRRVLKPGGTLSVNFVGRAHDLAFRHVAKTLRSVFPHVRCFAEMPEKPTEGEDKHQEDEVEVTNFVFFASSRAMDFRPPETRDAFNSMMRTYALHKRMENEIELPGPPLASSGSRADLVERRKYNNVTSEADLTADDLYYEFRGYGDLWAATTDDVEFCDPDRAPRDDGTYALPVARPGRVKRQAPSMGGPSEDVVKSMPHVLVDGGDEDAGDRLAEGLVGVAWSHYRIMREVVPLEVWMVY